MPIKVEGDDGVEKEVYTTEEMEAERAKMEAEYKGKLEEKDTYVKNKLDEFQKGKQSFELKEIEIKNSIEEAKKLAEEAKNETATERNKRVEIERNHLITSVVGSDPEMKKKLEGALENIDKTKVTDLSEQVKLAASMIGVTNNAGFGGNFSLTGGYAPNFIPKEQKLSDEEHNQFKNALGLE